jgi:hypothetical protein
MYLLIIMLKEVTNKPENSSVTCFQELSIIPFSFKTTICETRLELASVDGDRD